MLLHLDCVTNVCIKSFSFRDLLDPENWFCSPLARHPRLVLGDCYWGTKIPMDPTGLQLVRSPTQHGGDQHNNKKNSQATDFNNFVFQKNNKFLITPIFGRSKSTFNIFQQLNKISQLLGGGPRCQVLLFFTVYVVGVSARMIIPKEPEFKSTQTAMMTIFRTLGHRKKQHLGWKHLIVLLVFCWFKWHNAFQFQTFGSTKLMFLVKYGETSRCWSISGEAQVV